MYWNLKDKILFSIAISALILSTSCDIRDKNLPNNKSNILIVSDEKQQMDCLVKNLSEVNDYQFTQVLPENMDDDLSDFTHVMMYVHKTLEEESKDH